ncbi:MAG: proton-translocating transhydrogenase family protein, partial [Actinomycetia bacterium]|nr:proton-translocating transhydrogenase family protein [Actinomycetes bacterium]
APTAAAQEVAPVGAAEVAPRSPARKYALMALGGALVVAMAAFSPFDFLLHFTVFVLACIVGFYVISNVSHALHTPLMAETNAISGIILVGGILQLGSPDPVIQGIAFVATLVASINIFGGFAVTGRMLEMFRKD